MHFEIKNPISNEWYADPEARFYEGEYWIYVTRSRDYDDQLNHDAFHSKDLTNWEKAESIIDMSGFPHVKRAVWAPTIIEKNGKYYYIFACNDIQNDDMIGGLEIAVSDSPAGPFKAYLGHSLVDKFINGAQPIDAHLFKDDDGTVYLYYGGWKHCNVCIMNEDMTGFVPFPDGEIYKEITPEDYVEGPCMFKKDGKYYFLWSAGEWTMGSYRVNYAIGDSPVGEFKLIDTILKEDGVVAKGPGHNGYLYVEENDMWLNVYHRHKLDENWGNARYLCIDEMKFDGDKIVPVVMTHQWSK